MPDPDEPSTLVRCLAWLKARFARDEELAALSWADYDMLAADIGISPEQFRNIAPRITDHGWQMEAMMRVHGLDPDQVRRAFGPLMRDMELACAQCRYPGRCRRELVRGTAADSMEAFCANAATIDALAGLP